MFVPGGSPVENFGVYKSSCPKSSQQSPYLSFCCGCLLLCCALCLLLKILRLAGIKAWTIQRMREQLVNSKLIKYLTDLQVIESMQAGQQAMVFVHSRKDTGKTGRTMITKAQNGGDSALFDPADHPQWGLVSKDVKKSRNKCAPRRMPY